MMVPFNLRRTLAFLRIRQSRPAFLEPSRRLISGGRFRHVFQFKERRARRDVGSSLNGKRFQCSRERRGYIHKLAFDVALHAIIRPMPAARESHHQETNTRLEFTGNHQFRKNGG